MRKIISHGFYIDNSKKWIIFKIIQIKGETANTDLVPSQRNLARTNFFTLFLLSVTFLYLALQKMCYIPNIFFAEFILFELKALRILVELIGSSSYKMGFIISVLIPYFSAIFFKSFASAFPPFPK